MINHAYSTLFGKNAVSPSGIPVGLTADLHVPSQLEAVVTNIVGEDTAEAWDLFAVQALKVIDGSTFRKRVIDHDFRITYDVDALAADVVDFTPYLVAWLGLPPVAVQHLLVAEDYTEAYRGDIAQESVAALALSYVDALVRYNG